MDTTHRERLLDLHATTKRKVKDLQDLADRSTICEETRRLVAKAGGSKLILEDLEAALRDIGIIV